MVSVSEWIRFNFNHYLICRLDNLLRDSNIDFWVSTITLLLLNQKVSSNPIEVKAIIRSFPSNWGEIKKFKFFFKFKEKAFDFLYEISKSDRQFSNLARFSYYYYALFASFFAFYQYKSTFVS